jgi:hypothetical protein
MQITSAEQFVARPESRQWIRRAAKLGYAVKGAVYGVMGVLALQAALGLGGRVASERDAVEHIGRQPLGAVGLVVVGVGLLAYALWRIVEGVVDPYRHGNGPGGLAVRAGAIGSAIINGAVGVAALKLAAGEHAGGEDARPLAATLLREPWGIAALAVIGLSVLGAGIWQIYSAYSDKFAEHLDASRLTGWRRAWVFWSGRVGHAARGVVFGVIGVALVRAAVDANPRHTKGFKEALISLASQPFGQAILVLVSAGFLAYAVHLISTVPYRRTV